jgi:hypothetical protein
VGCKRLLRHNHRGTVTTPRNDVHIVVTGHRRVDLRGLSLRERAITLIGLAHPAFREKLSRSVFGSRSGHFAAMWGIAIEILRWEEFIGALIAAARQPLTPMTPAISRSSVRTLCRCFSRAKQRVVTQSDIRCSDDYSLPLLTTWQSTLAP